MYVLTVNYEVLKSIKVRTFENNYHSLKKKNKITAIILLLFFARFIVKNLCIRGVKGEELHVFMFQIICS